MPGWMLKILVCHAAVDAPIAEAIRTRLERCAEVEVSLAECGPKAGVTMVDAWETGTAGDAVILVLSPDAVGPRLDRDTAAPLLEHLARKVAPPVASVLAQPCAYPRLLERGRFHRWQDSAANQTLRELARWAIGLHPPVEPRTLEPAPLPWFDGLGPAEAAALEQALVDDCGIAAARSADHAQAFAHRAAKYFRDVIWLDPGDPLPVEDLRHRVLLVWNNTEAAATAQAEEELTAPWRRASVLLVEPAVAEAAVQPEHEEDVRIWRALAVCGTVHADVAMVARVAAIPEERAWETLRRLAAERFAIGLDAAGRRWRLSGRESRRLALDSGSVADIAELRRRHAQTVAETASSGAEWAEAFQWAIAGGAEDWRLAVRLAGIELERLRGCGDLDRLRRLCGQMGHAARERNDDVMARSYGRELAWLGADVDPALTRLAPGAQLQFEF